MSTTFRSVPPAHVALQVVFEEVEHVVHVAVDGDRRVRGDEDARRVPERTVRGQGLLLEDVECGRGELPRGERLGDRGLVDQRSPGDVDEHRAGTHGREGARVDQVTGLRGRRRGHDDGVAATEHLVESVGPEELVGRSRVDARLARAPPHAEDLAAQGPDPLCHRLADRAEADDADHRAREAAPVGRDEAVLPLQRLGLGKALPHLEQAPENELGHRGSAHPRCVRDDDPVTAHPRCGELVDAGTKALDPAQAGHALHQPIGGVELDQHLGAGERVAAGVRLLARPRRWLLVRHVGRGPEPAGIADGERHDLDSRVDGAEAILEAVLQERRVAEAHDQGLVAVRHPSRRSPGGQPADAE